MSASEFWDLSRNEFLSICITLNPSLNKSDEPFFNDEEQALLEQMKGW